MQIIKYKQKNRKERKELKEKTKKKKRKREKNQQKIPTTSSKERKVDFQKHDLKYYPRFLYGRVTNPANFRKKTGKGFATTYASVKKSG